jgi:hypothetical protein
MTAKPDDSVQGGFFSEDMFSASIEAAKQEGIAQLIKNLIPELLKEKFKVSYLAEGLASYVHDNGLGIEAVAKLEEAAELLRGAEVDQ